jgi:hypothetical protein
MEKKELTEKLKGLKGLLPSGRLVGAGFSFQWKDEEGHIQEFHAGPKLLIGFGGAFLASLMGLAVCAGLLFKAWDEQTELANYRADYGVYTERLAKLMDDNEKLQRELAQVVQVENAVRQKLAKDGVKIGEQTVDQKSKELDKKGQGGLHHCGPADRTGSPG